jgi:hypothetical protein
MDLPQAASPVAVGVPPAIEMFAGIEEHLRTDEG